MGDRGNIVVLDCRADRAVPIYLYSHWNGCALPLVVRDALRRECRWNDPPYLTRILFDQMTKGRQGNETGAGISAWLNDNEHFLVVVNTMEQTVSFSEETSIDDATGVPTKHIATWSFKDYIKLDDAALDKAFGLSNE